MIRLNRNHIFLIGLFTGLAFVGIHIFNFYSNSKFTTGKLLAWNGGYRTSYPVIQIEVDGKAYEFTGASNIELENNDQIPVIYNIHDPFNAAVYSFTGFYMNYFFFLIIPIMLYAAFIYSWFGKRDFVIVDFRKKKISKSNEIIKIN